MLRAPASIYLSCAAMGLASPLANAQTEWSLSAGLHQRHLTEFSHRGPALVQERGPLRRLRLTAVPTQPTADGAAAKRGAWHLQAELSAATLGYQGQTQDGEPARSSTLHREWALQGLWRLWPRADTANAWGDWEVGAHASARERHIAGIAQASGLVERSHELSPTLRWSSSFLSTCSATGALCVDALSATLRRSINQQLAVDFQGLLDPAQLRAGRQRALSLRLTGRVGADWRWGVELLHARQEASDLAPALLSGTPVGTLMQPRIRVREHGLWLERQLR